MENFTYSVTGLNAVQIWRPGKSEANGDLPSIYQDCSPNGDAWANAEAAASWAEAMIVALESPIEEKPVEADPAP
jgi:hypothetical protein